MYAKIEISGIIEIVTGMHIGGSKDFAAIGAVDSPVIKDVRTNRPMIPGSSLKGKMRTLLAKVYNKTIASKPDYDNEKLTRLFGSSKQGSVKTSRVLFSDMFLSNEEVLHNHGLQSLTEVKFENTINRITAVATPRQIERAIRGSEFELNLLYEADDEDKIVEDFEILKEGFVLLQYDYIGGNGSRGYGKIKFNNVEAKVVVGEVKESIVNKCNELLSEV